MSTKHTVAGTFLPVVYPSDAYVEYDTGALLTGIVLGRRGRRVSVRTGEGGLVTSVVDVFRPLVGTGVLCAFPGVVVCVGGLETIGGRRGKRNVYIFAWIVIGNA